jgi:hypothetical protein
VYLVFWVNEILGREQKVTALLLGGSGLRWKRELQQKLFLRLPFPGASQFEVQGCVLGHQKQRQ